MMIAIPPKYAVSQVIGFIKGKSAIHLARVDPDQPRDASWGERYFHMRDPDGHELSFARPLTASTK